MRVKWDDRHMRTAAAETWVIMMWMGVAIVAALGAISAFEGVPWFVPGLAAAVWFPTTVVLYLVFRRAE